MIKRIIAPAQAWMLSQGRCVGCGKNLELAVKVDRRDSTQKVTCSCRRIYIFDKNNKKYKRASFED